MTLVEVEFEAGATSGTDDVIQPVLLSGGSGSRLWPVSREAYPKQFLNLCGEASMLQETALRVAACDAFADPIAVCGAAQRFLVEEHLTLAGVKPTIVLEPMRRNTAFPIAVAALMAAKENAKRVLAILPADHHIPTAEAFSSDLQKAAQVALEGPHIVTIGIEPTSPETGFGYIRKGGAHLNVDGAADVAAFVEKPNAEIAATYLATGEYVWNSGMFVATAATLLAAFEAHSPRVLEAASAALSASSSDLNFLRLGSAGQALCPDISFDNAVMELVEGAKVLKASFTWSDLGSWNAIWTAGGPDEDGNVFTGDVVATNTADTYVRTEGPLVASFGVKDLVIVAMRDAVLVADRHSTQDMKKVVSKLKEMNRSEAETHARCYRPWGSYETLCLGDRFQVKRIVVKPGGKLSLQSHMHRAEHWVVVSGTAIVTVDETEKVLQENQSVYVPLGAVHRLENKGKIDLHLIEVQSGAYLGEDDIIRYEDVYARA